MTSFPQLDVAYRILSAETGEYLELRDIDMKAVALRSLKDDDHLEQQWIFVDFSEDDSTYLVLNAATKGCRHPRYLSIDPNIRKIVAIAEDVDENSYASDDGKGDDLDLDEFDGPESWLVNQVDNGLYTLTCKGKKRNTEIFLVVDDDEKAGYIEVKASNRNQFPKNRMWHVLKVSDSEAQPASTKLGTSGSTATEPGAPPPSATTEIPKGPDLGTDPSQSPPPPQCADPMTPSTDQDDNGSSPNLGNTSDSPRDDDTDDPASGYRSLSGDEDSGDESDNPGTPEQRARERRARKKHRDANVLLIAARWTGNKIDSDQTLLPSFTFKIHPGERQGQFRGKLRYPSPSSSWLIHGQTDGKRVVFHARQVDEAKEKFRGTVTGTTISGKWDNDDGDSGKFTMTASD